MSTPTAKTRRVRDLLQKARGIPRRGYLRLKQAYLRHDASYLIFCFLLPFLLMEVIFAIVGVWPFGKGTILTLDFNGQYVYFFEALRDFVWGDTTLLYSFSRALGGEFLGMYAYYLASPLSYIVALFPEGSILEALHLMLLIKQGLAGLTFGYFLRKTTSVTKTATVIFSTVYAMTGYGVVMQHNTMWTDNVILLPLLALGIRALVCERKYKLYTVSLILCMMSNYYIGYMSCIFSVLYFFYVHVALPSEVKNPENRRFAFLRSGVRFGVFSLLAGAVSMLIVLPAAYSLTFGKTEFTKPVYEFVSKIDILDILTKFFFGTYDTVRPEGYPFVYCGIITLLLVPFYYVSRRITTRQKAADTLLCLILLFSFSIQVIDMMWHGGQAPNWLNYRYSYMLCFLLVGMAARAFDGARHQSAKWVLYGAAPLLLILVLAEHFGYEHLHTEFFPVALNVLCIGIYAVALSLYVARRKVAKRFASLCMLILVCVEMTTGGLMNYGQLMLDVGMASRTSYYGFKERWSEAFDTVKAAEDAPFYRMEKLKYRKVNDPFLLDYRGVSGSTSTLNADTVAFLNAMGYASASHASCYTGTNPFVDSLLSISYVAGEASTVFPDSYEKVYDNGDVVMYRNPNALSLAFGASSAINGITLRTYELDSEGNRVNPDDDRVIHVEASPFLRMNAIASALLGEEVELFVPATAIYSEQNVAHVSSSRYFTRRDPSKDAYINYTVKVPEGGELFAYFPIDYPEYKSTPADYYLNGELIGQYFIREESGYLCLGSYEAGETATVSFKLGESGVYYRQGMNYFYTMDNEVYTRLMDTLSAGGYRITECTDAYFEGTITVYEGRETIFTTIPYDKGWRITVDGVAVEGYETLDALLAFDLAPGEHTLTLEYMPTAYILGFCAFLGGGAVLLTVIVVEYYAKRKKKRKSADAERKDCEICSTTSEES